MTDTTTIPTDRLRALFDIAAGSMNFTSGFLDTAEVETLRAVALTLGVDPAAATPNEFVSQYPHPRQGLDPALCVASYGRCGKPAGDPIHGERTP
jgi:hypothetical protein